MAALRDFFLVDLLTVHSTPYVGYIAKDKWDEEGDVSHRAECKQRTAGILYREGALEVGSRRIEGCIIPTRKQQENKHRENRADTDWPNTTNVGFAANRADDAIEDESDAQNEHNSQRPQC